MVEEKPYVFVSKDVGKEKLLVDLGDGTGNAVNALDGGSV